MAAGRQNKTFNPYGAAADDRLGSLEYSFNEPRYRRAVGTYAANHAEELKEPSEPPKPPTPEPEPEADLKAGIDPPTTATTTSAAAYQEAMKRGNLTVWDPEERFSKPVTESMAVGWGARKQPAETVRYPRKVSATTRAAEQLLKTSGKLAEM